VVLAIEWGQALGRSTGAARLSFEAWAGFRSAPNGFSPRMYHFCQPCFTAASSYLGKTDSHKNAEVRGVLEPLSAMAERMRVAVLSVTHFSKSGAANTTKALHRFIGSIAFVGAPRMAFAVIEDADDKDRRLLLHAKNNLAPPPQGLAFGLQQTIVGEPGKGIVASRVHWERDPVTITANEALAAESGNAGYRPSEEAESFLRELLADGPVPAKQVKADADDTGLSWTTVRRAKERLGIKPHKAGMDAGWL
jgi:putative DNA primase/helicase